MLLTLYIGEANGQGNIHNAVAKSKGELENILKDQTNVEYSRFALIQVEYSDAFDLFTKSTGLNGGRQIGDHKVLREYNLIDGRLKLNKNLVTVEAA